MEFDEFYNSEFAQKARELEQSIASGIAPFVDSEELEDVTEYFIGMEQYQKASTIVNYGLDIYPYDSFFKVKKAEILVAKREINAALKYLEKIKSSDPNNADIYKLIGDCYFLSMQHKRAVDFYQTGLNIHENEPDIIAALVRCYLILDKPTKSIMYFAQLLEISDSDDPNLAELMSLFYNAEHYEKSIEVLEKVIDKHPYNYVAWYFLGQTFQQLNKLEKAVWAFDMCTAIDEHNPIAYLAMGACLADQDKFQEAIDFIEQNLDPLYWEADIYCTLAECYEKVENLKKSKKYYFDALKLDPHLSDAHFGLGLIYKREMFYTKAEKSLKKAISIDPFESLYHIELAELYLEVEDYEACCVHYTNAIEYDPDTVEIRLDYSYALFEMLDINLAIEVLEDAIFEFEDKEDHRLYYRLAAYSFHAGLEESAFNALQKALEIDPTDYQLIYEFAPFLENNDKVSFLIDLYNHDNE